MKDIKYKKKEHINSPFMIESVAIRCVAGSLFSEPGTAPGYSMIFILLPGGEFGHHPSQTFTFLKTFISSSFL